MTDDISKDLKIAVGEDKRLQGSRIRNAVPPYVHENMSEGQRLGYAGRPASASPAVGYAHLHQEQQKALLDQAFAKLKGFVLSK